MEEKILAELIAYSADHGTYSRQTEGLLYKRFGWIWGHIELVRNALPPVDTYKLFKANIEQIDMDSVWDK